MNKLLILFLVLFAFSCQNEEIKRPAPDVDLNGFSSGKQIVDEQGNTYKTGYEQKSDGSYQNPYLEKLAEDGKRIWKEYYEESSVDGRGVMVVMDVDGITPVVVFTVDGGSYDDAYISKYKVENDAFFGVYQNSYAAGGGPKVSIMAKINPATGLISKATFLTARKNDGKTNGFGIDEIKIVEQAIIIKATTSAWPPGKGNSYSRFPEITDADRIDGWFKMYYEISHDLSSINRAEIFVN